MMKLICLTLFLLTNLCLCVDLFISSGSASPHSLFYVSGTDNQTLQLTSPIASASSSVSVFALAHTPQNFAFSSAVFAVGNFTQIGEQLGPSQGFAYWSENQWFSINVAAPSQFYAVYFIDELSAVVAGGTNTVVVYCTPAAQKSFLCPSAAATSDPSAQAIASGISGTVQAIAYDSDLQCLYIGGSTMQINGSSSNVFSMCEGQSNWTPLPKLECLAFCTSSSFVAGVYALIVVNGQLFAGGRFDSSGANTINNAAVLQDNVWVQLGGGLGGSGGAGVVFSFGYFKEAIYACGNFAPTDTSIHNIATWNDGTSAWVPVGGGLHMPSTDSKYGVWAMAFDEDMDMLYAGGLFQAVDGGLTAATATLAQCEMLTYEWTSLDIPKISSKVLALSIRYPGVPPSPSPTLTPETPSPAHPAPTAVHPDAGVSPGIVTGIAIVVVVAMVIAIAAFVRWVYHRRRTSILAKADVLLAGYNRTDSTESSEYIALAEREEFVIPEKQIKILREVASGASGSVSLGLWNNTYVAVKRYHNALAKNEFVLEAKTHMRLRHPNVVQLLGVCVGEKVATVTEFMERGSLYHVLHNTSIDLNWDRKMMFAVDIARGLAYLHSSRTVHRDIKSLNIFVNEGWQCKVGDFGLSRSHATTMTLAAGTLLWIAPEVLIGDGHYTESADVYSFGIVLWEILTRRDPYDDKTGPLVAAITKRGERPTMPTTPDVPLFYSDLITRCWSQDPSLRPTITEVLDILLQHSAASTLSSIVTVPLDSSKLLPHDSDSS